MRNVFVEKWPSLMKAVLVGGMVLFVNDSLGLNKNHSNRYTAVRHTMHRSPLLSSIAVLPVTSHE